METNVSIKEFMNIEQEKVNKLFDLLNLVKAKHFLDKRMYKTIELCGKDVSIKNIYVVRDFIKMGWQVIDGCLSINIYGSILNTYNSENYVFNISKIKFKNSAYFGDNEIISISKNGIDMDKIGEDECELLTNVIVFVTSILVNTIDWENKLNTTYSEACLTTMDMINTFIRPMLNQDYLTRFEDYLLNISSDGKINVMLSEKRTFFSYHRPMNGKYYLRMSVDITHGRSIRVGFERFEDLDELRDYLYRPYSAIEFDLFSDSNEIIMELRNTMIDLLDIESIYSGDYRNYIAIMIRDFGMINKNDL